MKTSPSVQRTHATIRVILERLFSEFEECTFIRFIIKILSLAEATLFRM